MAANTPTTLEEIFSRVPENLQSKLDEKVDSKHAGVSKDVGYIASRFTEWEGRVSDELNLTTVETSDIKQTHRGNPEQQRRAALEKWIEKTPYSTYRNLIRAFHRAEKTDCCDIVIDILCKNEGLPPSKGSNFNLENISRALYDVIKWDHLGERLGVSSHELKEISKNYHTKGIDEMKSQMLKVWLDEDRNASWEKLYQALCKMSGHEAVANKLSKEFITAAN